MAKHYKIKKNFKILDVGCGKGFFLCDFKKMFPNINTFGIDVSKYAVKKAPKLIKDNLIVGNAKKLPWPDNYFDIAFIDADKDNYKKYYDNSLELIKKNGIIIIDNVLWHGEVADKYNNEKYTNIIRDFNTHVKNDKKTEQVIIPLGDGFTICRKL